MVSFPVMTVRRLRTALLSGCLLLASCTPWPLESAEPPPQPAAPGPSVTFAAPVVSGALAYQGGDVTLRADLTGIAGDSLATWRLGTRAVLLSQGFVRAQDGTGKAWAVLRWDTLGLKDSVAKASLDTISLQTQGTILGSVVVRLENILPKLDSVLSGSSLDTASLRGTPLRGDTIDLFAHCGATAYLRLRFRDPDRNFPARLQLALPMTLPNGGTLRWRNGDPSDSVLVWQTSDSLFDTTLAIVQTDGLGAGTRSWNLRLASYREEGSVWVGQRNQLVKFGRTTGGKVVEIARLKGFSEVVGLTIDPTREGGLLYGVDRIKASVFKYTTEGLARTVKAKVRRPQSIACNNDQGWCLAGDRDSSGNSYVVRVDGDTASVDSLPGTPLALVVDQGASGRAWVMGRDSGYVARIRNRTIEDTLTRRLSRPSAMAYDDSLGILWVADLDSATVTGLDDTGGIVKVLRGFKQPQSVSASRGRVWVADPGDRTLSRWKPDGTLEKRFTGLVSPVAVVCDPHAGTNAWALDMEVGKLLRFEGDSLMAQSSGSGLDRPDLLVVHPGSR